DVLVKSHLISLYDPGDEGMYISADVYLVETNWVARASCTNQLFKEHAYDLPKSSRLMVTRAANVEQNLNLSRVFNNLSITVDGQLKMPMDQGMTNGIHLVIPSRSNVYVYQKRYKFKVRVFFLWDAYNQLWNVGMRGGQGVFSRECVFEILAEEYAVMDRKIEGFG
ncbi:hypothetical protein AMATHDRAFT_118948, partial [Amanita thiersii Skay4041]